MRLNCAILIGLLAITGSMHAQEKVRTSSISDHVVDSYAIAKFGAPVYVTIANLAGGNAILLRGVDPDDTSKVSDANSRAILTLATIAWATNKQLELTYVKFDADKREMFVKTAKIIK